MALDDLEYDGSSDINEYMEDLSNKEDISELTIINTNAQSLCPKINSLVDCFGN